MKNDVKNTTDIIDQFISIITAIKHKKKYEMNHNNFDVNIIGNYPFVRSLYEILKL